MSTAYSPGGFQNGLELLGQHHVALDLQLAAHEGLHAIQLAFCHGHEVSIRHGNGAVLALQGFEQSGCNDSEGSEETQGTARPQDDLRFRQHCPSSPALADPLPFFRSRTNLPASPPSLITNWKTSAQVAERPSATNTAIVNRPGSIGEAAGA